MRGGEGEELNKGREPWGNQTSFVQCMMAGWTRQQMKLDHGKGVISVILGM